LEKAFPDQLEIKGEAVPGMSGSFEVVLVESGKVLHSKNNGQGYVDTGAKLDAIISGIKEVLGE
jgi:selT/selW/selH-like putative selenoprotein